MRIGSSGLVRRVKTLWVLIILWVSMCCVIFEAPEICVGIKKLPSQVQENSANSDEAKLWFAMRVTFRRELNVKQMLDDVGIENFIPMRREVKIVKGRRMQVLVPVIHNLIFVYAEKKRLQEFKAGVPYLQYMTNVEAGKRVPIIVPEYQMNNFIKVSSSEDSNLIYFDSVGEDIAAGTMVRIHGGQFDEVTGTFVKIKGKRNKKVVICVKNILAVAIDAVSYDYMEIIK